MALTPVLGLGGAKAVLDLALSSSYLGSGNEIVVTRATRFDLWCDDAAIAIAFKVSFDGGTTFSAEFAAPTQSIIPIAIPVGGTLTLDVKSASGTPKAGGYAYGA